MYQHQPRVGFDTQALDPFVFDPMRSVKCEWEISDGKQVVTGECKSLLRNFAKYIRGMMGGAAQDGKETLRDVTGVDRVVGCQSQATYYSGIYYGTSTQGWTRKCAIHVGTDGTPVAHTDAALGAEVQNTLSGAGSTEASSVVFATPTITATEFAFTVSATITPSASGTINEVGLSTRLFHSVFDGGASAWTASNARFLMVRDVVAGGYNAVAGTPYTVKFTFRFLQTTTAFFSQIAARWFMRILHDVSPTNSYAAWDDSGSYDVLADVPRSTAVRPVLVGVSDSTTPLSMTTQGLGASALALTSKPVITDELTDAVRCRWNAALSHTFTANKTIRQAVLAVQQNSTGYYFAWAFATLPTPIAVTAGSSQAFKFTFEIAV